MLSGEITGAPDFKALVPRVSLVYDIFGDGRTALKFAASRYNQPITLQNVLRLNPLGATSDTRVWTVCAAGQTSGCDLNGDLVPQMNELGVSSGFTFGANNRYADDLKWPVSNEYSLELQRQIPGNMVALRRLHTSRDPPQHRLERTSRCRPTPIFRCR